MIVIMKVEYYQKKRKHTRRQISDNSESSRLTDTSSKEWIWKKINHVAEIKKIQEFLM